MGVGVGVRGEGYRGWVGGGRNGCRGGCEEG